MYVYFTEALLYLCFALTIGSTVWNGIAADKKPVARLSSNWVFFAAVGIPVFSFFSLLSNTLFISKAIEMGFWEIIPDVLRDLAFGQAWFKLLVLSCIMLFLMSFRNPQQHRWVNTAVAVLLFLIVYYHGWASHPAGQSETWGFYSQVLHVLTVSIWTGVLLICGWFVGKYDNWPAFLKWFTPLSVACVVLLTIAGIVIMAYIVTDLTDSWGINYGQALLIKHLLFIPILVFGFGNGFMLKKTSSDQLRKIWLRVESGFIMLVFAITGFMNFQPPPHPDEADGVAAASPLFEWIKGGNIGSQTLNLQWNPPGVLVGIIALAMIALLLQAMRRSQYKLAVSAGLGFVISGYLSLTLSVAPG